MPQVTRQKKERKDPMEVLLQGLNIAQSGLGIAVNYQKLQEYGENRDLAARKEARETAIADAEAKGIITPEKEAKLQASGLEIVPEGTSGATQLYKKLADGSEVPVWMKRVDVEGAKVASEERRVAREEKNKQYERLSDVQDKFRKETEPVVRQISDVNATLALLNSPNRASINSELAKRTLMRAAGAVGDMSAAEAASYQASQDVIGKANAAVERLMQNKATEDDINTLTQAATVYQKMRTNQFRQFANAYADQKAELFNMKQDEFLSSVLRPESFLKMSTVPQVAEQPSYTPVQQPGASLPFENTATAAPKPVDPKDAINRLLRRNP